MSEAATENGLGAELRSAVEGIEGVSIEDKGGYYTVKHGTKTLGYVNGSRKIRVDFPIRDKVREKLAVSDASQIPAVVEKMSTFIPPLEQEATPDPKPSRRKKAEA